jgi:hypothetical protein
MSALGNIIPQSEVAYSGPDMARTVLQYPGLALQVVLDDADPVGDALAKALRGWTPCRVENADPAARLSSVLGAGGTYAARSAYLQETIHGLGVAGAACAVIADLAQDYFVTRPGCLALHCAAFRFNNRLIALTGPARAGKSTLAARMTQEPDMSVFCDDVLPLLADGHAVGLGIAPRLRLPLPEGCSNSFKAHVAGHTGPNDHRYAYLSAPTVAPHGTKAPLSTLLILDRRSDAEACLHEVSDDEALHYLLSQNMADLETADAAVARLTGLLRRIICLRLVYSDLEDAVALIRHAFGGGADVHADVTIEPPVPQAASRIMPVARLAPTLVWSRRPDAMLQTTGDGGFLWMPGQRTVWRMNALGLAVWTLLEIPGSAQDIAAVLADHFNDQDESTLTADVNALLQALADGGLIETSDVTVLSR